MNMNTLNRTRVMIARASAAARGLPARSSQSEAITAERAMARKIASLGLKPVKAMTRKGRTSTPRRARASKKV
jgi:hypothetical protein